MLEIQLPVHANITIERKNFRLIYPNGWTMAKLCEGLTSKSLTHRSWQTSLVLLTLVDVENVWVASRWHVDSWRRWEHLGAILIFESSPNMPGTLKMPGQYFLHCPKQRPRQIPPVMFAGTEEDAGMRRSWDQCSVSVSAFDIVKPFVRTSLGFCHSQSRWYRRESYLISRRLLSGAECGWMLSSGPLAQQLEPLFCNNADTGVMLFAFLSV